MHVASPTLKATVHSSASHGSVESHLFKPRNATRIHYCIMLLCNDRTRVCATSYKDYTDYEQTYTHSTTAGKIQHLIRILPFVSKEEAQVNSHICMPFSVVCSSYAKDSQKLRRFGSTKWREAVLYKVTPFLCLPRVLFPLDFPWRQHGKVRYVRTEPKSKTVLSGDWGTVQCTAVTSEHWNPAGLSRHPCSTCLKNSLKQNSPANKKLQTRRTNAHRNTFNLYRTKVTFAVTQVKV
jgi:hypothetical protein